MLIMYNGPNVGIAVLPTALIQWQGQEIDI